MLVLVAGVTVPANAATAQSFELEGIPMIWINAQRGECLGVAGGNMAPGTAVIVWPCNREDDQKWIAEVFGSDRFVIRNFKDRNRCLSVANMSLANQAPLVIWDCKHRLINQDQRWTINDTATLPDRSRTPSGSMFFVNENSGLKMGMATWPLLSRQVVQEYEPVLKDMAWFGVPA
jgi:hypothetical protein